MVAKILSEFDYSLLDSEIRWIRPVPGQEIGIFLIGVARRIVTGEV